MWALALGLGPRLYLHPGPSSFAEGHLQSRHALARPHPAAGRALCTFVSWRSAVPAQRQPLRAWATPRILLLPRRIVSGERATLAVLDVNGRLAPGVTVNFSNGDHLTTDQTGRALFVAPLNAGTIFGSIAGRPGRVATAIVMPSESELSQVDINSIPRIASLSDRFDIIGHGFCGDADANTVTVGGQPALVLASSRHLSRGPSPRGPRTGHCSGANHLRQKFISNYLDDFSRAGASRRHFSTGSRRTSQAHRQRKRHRRQKSLWRRSTSRPMLPTWWAALLCAIFRLVALTTPRALK